MAVHHAFWISRGAGGVAHAGGAVLIEPRPQIRLVGSLGQQRLILIAFASDDDQLADARYAVANLLEDREKRLADEDEAIFSVSYDVRQVVRGEPQIQRMEHGAIAGDREVEFHVLVRVPGERAHAL